MHTAPLMKLSHITTSVTPALKTQAISEAINQLDFILNLVLLQQIKGDWKTRSPWKGGSIPPGPLHRRPRISMCTTRQHCPTPSRHSSALPRYRNSWRNYTHNIWTTRNQASTLL